MVGLANDLNISQPGIVVHNGSGVFTGVTLTQGSGISITNGSGISGNPTISLAGGGIAIQTISGDSGSITGSNVTIFSNNSNLNAGQSVSFVNSGTVSTLNVTDASFNTVIGKGAGKLGQTYNTTTVLGALAGAAMTSAAESVFIGAAAGNAVTSAQNNTFVGANSGVKVTTGSANTAVGLGSLSNATTGAANAGSNVAIGYNSLDLITTGTFNTALGASAGSAHTTSDSSNIDIGNVGTAAQSNTIRIGTQGTGSGQQNTAFMAGITGVSVSNQVMTTLDSSTGQLGTVSSVPIANGGTNATSMSTSSGIVKYDGTRLVTSSTATIDGSNIQKNTAQPAFEAYLSGNASNVTGDGTLYSVVFDSEVFDQSNSFNTSTGVFTAPVAGRYLFTGLMYLFNMGVAHNLYLGQLVTTGATFPICYNAGYVLSNGGNLTSSFGIFCNMAANDTAFIKVEVGGGTKTVGLAGAVGNMTFSGCLIC